MIEVAEWHEKPVPVSINDLIIYAMSEFALNYWGSDWRDDEPDGAASSQLGFWSQPGTIYKYSNFGYIFLGQLLATNASNRPARDVEAILRHNIFNVLGLEYTSFGGSTEAECQDGEVYYYSKDEESRDVTGDNVEWVDVGSSFDHDGPYAYWGLDLSILTTAGAIVTNVIDLALYLRDLQPDGDLQTFDGATLWRTLLMRTDYAGFERSLGWNRYRTYADHNGAAAGTQAFAQVREDSGVAFSCLFNARTDGGENWVDTLADKIGNRFRADEESDSSGGVGGGLSTGENRPETLAPALESTTALQDLFAWYL